jgi:spermidine synthase
VSTDRPQRLPVYSVALLSATALAYEVLLVRLFSIIQWHHYAYMIISLALLGYGASGTFLALAFKPLLRHFRVAFITSIALFGLATLGCFLVAQRIPFNPEELLYDTGQWLNLTGMYLVLSLPFFFAASAIGLALAQYRGRLARVYAADLMGAGLGSLAVVLLLFALFPMPALRLLSAMGSAAALVAVWETGLRVRAAYLLLACLAIAPAILPATWTELAMSPYKDLSQSLRVTGTRVVQQRSSPLGLIDVVESRVIPLRHAPGLSLNATSEPPQQLALFIDGNGPSAITGIPSDPTALDYLDQLTSALPYHLRTPDSVLVLGAGGGTSVLQALHLGAHHVDAVELNPQIVKLVRDTYGAFSGGIYRDARVRVITAEARGFLATDERHYDLIQIPILDSFGASSAGLYALSEDYLYTVEGLQAYLRHLTPGGLLAINRWVKMPPRDTLKALATAIEALERSGLEDAAQRLAVIRGWQTSTLLVKNGTFSAAELAAVRRFCEARSFDLVYLPGMAASEANRFNLLTAPYFFASATQLLGSARESFFDRYKFNLRPATDDRPYFFHFFRWRTLPEILRLYGQGGVPLMDIGYLVLLATLIQASAASLILILLPLWVYHLQRRQTPQRIGRARVLVYFAALGLAFLFIEIAFIQKLILFLHQPLYAVAVALSAFLLFAGLGSAWSQRFTGPRDKDRRPGILRPVAAVVTLCVLYLATLDDVFAQLMHLPDLGRILISILLIAPLAFCMGMPFPLGLAQLGQHAPQLMPWAWGINGCASVISTVLATLLAMHVGFTAVVASAGLLYLLAAASFPRASPQLNDRHGRAAPASA